MRTVKDVYNVCQKTVCRLNKAIIEDKQDLAFKLSKALDNKFIITTCKGRIGITLSSLELNTSEPLLIVKTTFTKEHGLKHCVLKINPKLEDFGLRFDTSLEDACLFLRCLYRLNKKGYIKKSDLSLKNLLLVI